MNKTIELTGSTSTNTQVTTICAKELRGEEGCKDVCDECRTELQTKVCSERVSPAFGNTLLCAAHTNELQEPYKYCRECFYRKIDELRPPGACSSQKYNGKIDYQTLAHLDRVKFMSFGVHEWLYNKALNGCEESLWKLEYGYNLFNEVQSKAKEEGLLGCP